MGLDVALDVGLEVGMGVRLEVGCSVEGEDRGGNCFWIQY